MESASFATFMEIVQFPWKANIAHMQLHVGIANAASGFVHHNYIQTSIFSF